MKRPHHQPELILYNGNFQTQDRHFPIAQAVAIAQGFFVAVGDNASVKALATSDTQQIDMEGRLGLPGLIILIFTVMNGPVFVRGLI